MSAKRPESQPREPKAKGVDVDKLTAKLARLNREAEQLAEIMKQKPKN